MYRKIYFMGIKGVGMATLAIIAKEARLRASLAGVATEAEQGYGGQAGFIVSGSDVEEEFITDEILKDAGIDVLIGFRKDNPEAFFGTTPKEECLFIATAAHEGFNNVEAEWARDNGIKVISHGEAVGTFMSGDLFDRKFERVSVSGSHGKTTIVGMISVCLSSLGSDPSFTAGTSEIFPIGAAGHLGTGKYFVAEADEYFSEGTYDKKPKFLYQEPKYLIINNIDFDHPDMYPNLESVISAYKEFVSNLRDGGFLIINGDDENIKKLTANNQKPRAITYGTGDGNEFVIKNFRQEGFGCRFEVLRNSTSLGTFELSIPGYHNAKNSLSVIALLIELGISVKDIQRALFEFKGVKRRLEKIGETKTGVLVFDDYAHHPEEIRKTLEALQGVYPDKKITVVFQAHTYGRTKALLSEFASSFVGVSELIVLPTFASARDSRNHGLKEDQEFVEKIRVVQPNVKLIENQALVVEYIEKNIQGSDKIVTTMGAGDVYKIAYKISK